MLITLASSDKENDAKTDEDAQVALSAREDPDAFASLYHRYLDSIYRYCYRRLGSPEAAEDATSQVFYRALRSIEQFRGGSFRAWLFRIAYTTVVDSYKQRTLLAPEADAEAADPDPTPEQQAIRREGHRNVETLLKQLTSDQRRVVELRLAGLKGPEIAEAMDRTPESVRMLQYRAMEKLRSHLEKDHASEATDDQS